MEPHRPDRLEPLPQPDPGHQRPDRLVARSSTTRSSWPSTTTSSPSSTATWPTAPTTGSSASYGDALDGPIAYFCAEYGLHESLGIYSGGLGVLAGDHMKSASDMALPFVGVGLLYRKGYFRQTIDADGHQEHDYPDYDLTRLPLARVQDADGLPLTVTVELPGRDLAVAVWLAQVGRVPVLLLDTDVAGERRSRTGRSPTSCTSAAARCGSTRSSSSASAACARSGRSASRRRSGTSTRATPRSCSPSGPASTSRPAPTLDDAWAKVRRDSVFTIHTPVSAGNERFDADLVRRVAGPLLDARRRAGRAASSSSGVGMDGDRGQFDMTAFSLRLTNGANAVSQLHAETANAHVARHHRPRRSWASPTASTARPGSARRSPTCSRATSTPTSTTSTPSSRQDRFWERLERIPARRPVGGAPAPEARARRSSPAAGCAASSPATARRPSVLAELETALDPNDPDHRLRPPVRDVQARRPAVQRHRPAAPACCGTPTGRSRSSSPARPTRPTGPASGSSRRSSSARARRELRGRVFILEDYDMRVGRFLVQGVDVWLNNPRRPLEASGTSGMKAAQNGVPNISVLDGWWDEGYTGDNGWAIGGRETNPDEAAQDWADAQDLYRLLEEEIVPRYYDARRERRPAALARASCAGRWRRPSGGSPRPGCSTSTPSGCTCRRPASTVRETPTDARSSTEAG